MRRNRDYLIIEHMKINASSVAVNLSRAGFQLQLIRAENRDNCEPGRFQVRTVTISYRMIAVYGIPMNWLPEVSHCDEPKRSVYEQRIGPFKFWSHEMRLTET